MESEWWRFVRRIAPDATQKQIAEAAGVEPSNISRWKQGRTQPSAGNAIRFARAYSTNPISALVAAGYLTVEDLVGVVEVVHVEQTLTNDELLDMLRNRLERA